MGGIEAHQRSGGLLAGGIVTQARFPGFDDRVRLLPSFTPGAVSGQGQSGFLPGPLQPLSGAERPFCRGFAFQKGAIIC